jgi:RsiW-degrading membrane proteinase PrsW (M82 family)
VLVNVLMLLQTLLGGGPFSTPRDHCREVFSLNKIYLNYMDFLIQIGFAIVGGIVPAGLWLFFWLREDDEHPEPNSLIIKTFIYGMISACAAIVIQKLSVGLILNGQSIYSVFYANYPIAILAIVIGASSEELVKYIGALFGGLSNKANDEPIDPIIYMITAALGFAALENTLYLIGPIFQGDFTSAIVTGNMRFIGATLLHVSASAIIGIFMSFSYYKNAYVKKRYVLAGFVLSAALHSVFNSFIIRAGAFTLVSFGIVWISIVIIFMLFEKAKNHLPNVKTNTQSRELL